MKAVLGLFVALACVACNGGGGDDDSMIIVPVGGMTGAGGEGGAGAQGGQGGGAQGGEGGQGGAGAQGGQGGAGAQGGEGGQGGAGAQGGEGGQGGAGAQGGEGGGCSPDCDGRTCGPNGCGGECGPGCGDAEVCADGACMPGECPDGTFECGGNCADLLTDANHCGSCGKSCADEWPQEWTEAGFTFEGANIEAICAQAECTFMCAESETGPQELIEDPQNCGSCGTVCNSDAVNSIRDACVGAQCACVLTLDGEEGVAARTCGQHCELPAKNCQDDCCPDLAAQQVVPQTRDYDDHHFILDVPEIQGLELELVCDGFGGQYGNLIRYYDNGLVGLITRLRCNEQLRLPIVEAGHYAVTVGESDDGPITLNYRGIRGLDDDFAAPGDTQRPVSGNRINFIFSIAEGGPHTIRFSEVDGSCDGPGQVRLLNPQGEVVHLLRETNDCVFDLDAYWEGELAAGQYVLDAFAERLSGQYALQILGAEPPPDPDMFPMIIPFDGFGQNGSDTIPLRFNEAGRYQLTTANADGEDCPGDTLLALRGPGGELANNDDANGVPGNCSRITHQFEADTDYQAVISGYNQRAIGAGALVVERP